MRRSLALFLFVFAVALGQVAPAAADPSDAASYRGEFERIRAEMRELWFEMHSFHPEAKYCYPPGEPIKIPHIVLMQTFDARTRALVARYNAMKQSLKDFLNNNHRIAAEMVIDDVDPREDKYWQNSPFQQETDRLQRKFNERNAELKAAPERNCGAQPPKKAEVVVAPPVNLTDPGVALPAVQVRDIEIPPVPARFCSEAEKKATLNQFWDVSWPFYMNYQDAREYESAIGQMLRAGVGNTAALNAMLPKASAETKRHAKRLDDFQNTYDRVRAMPIENCGGEKPKEIGALPANMLGASAGVAVAVGDVTIPKKPYLSLETGGDQLLGVVDHERRVTMAAIMLTATYNLGFMPEINLGKVRDQIWRAFLEVESHDFTAQSSGGSIVTTTEGVGVPGTGDPFANFPAGIFIANPALNDVSDIAFHHTSEYDALSLGIEHSSMFDCSTVTFGAGMSFSRQETTDVLGGRFAAYPIDFRYHTGVETRNFGLLMRAGAEVPLDFWDASARYAGEFSGFRIRGEVEARVNFLDSDGVDRLDISGFVSDAQAVRIGKDDTTFGYRVGASLNYNPPEAEALYLGVGIYYDESDTHPVSHRSGQTGDQTQLDFEERESIGAFVRSTFSF